MVDRVCLGKRNPGEFGLFISKPGVNVMTAPDHNLIFSSSIRAFQIIQSGYVSIPAYGSGTLTYPNSGFRPLIIAFPTLYDGNFISTIASSEYHVWFTAITHSSCTVNMNITDPGKYTGQTAYFVFARPMDG